MLISRFNNTNIDKYINDFQTKYKVIIPPEYKNFLLKYNGGKTPESKFKIGKISSDIRGFYGLGECEDNLDYLYLEKIHVLQDFLNDNYLPIAVNSFGDYIVIDINVDNKEGVYFYYHDRPKKYIEISENFAEFIKKCKSDKIGKISSIEDRKERLIKNGKEANITPGLIELWQKEIDYYSNVHQEQLIL